MLKAPARSAISSHGASYQVPLSFAVVPSTTGTGSTIVAPVRASALSGTSIVRVILLPPSTSSTSSFELPYLLTSPGPLLVGPNHIICSLSSLFS